MMRRRVILPTLACLWLLAVTCVALGQPPLDDFRVLVLPAPPTRALRTAPAPGATAGGSPRTLLVQLSAQRNRITNTDDWFRSHALSLPSYEIPNPGLRRQGTVPPSIPRVYRGHGLVHAIRQHGAVLLVYGGGATEGRYLVAADVDRNTYRYGYDFVRYVYPPGISPGGRAGPQGIVWAVERDRILYVSNSNLNYARESRGMNAYVTAIRAGTNQLLWRSPPLVANAFTFEVLGDFVVSGYGFTAEPDFLYVLNRLSGEIVQRVPLGTAPEYIIRKGDRLYVRGYNTDFVFGIVPIR